MTRSAVKPSEYEIRKFEGVTAYIGVRKNIKQILVEDMNEENHTEYEYDEKEIAVQIPDNLIIKAPKLLSKRVDVTKKTDLARSDTDIKNHIQNIQKKV